MCFDARASSAWIGSFVRAFLLVALACTFASVVWVNHGRAMSTQAFVAGVVTYGTRSVFDWFSSVRPDIDDDNANNKGATIRPRETRTAVACFGMAACIVAHGGVMYDTSSTVYGPNALWLTYTQLVLVMFSFVFSVEEALVDRDLSNPESESDS